MPSGPDPLRARAATARLDALRALTADAEDDVLASLVVTGEPAPQRVLDDWLDHVVDSLRALGEAADEVHATVSRFAAAPSDAGPDAGPDQAAGPAARPAQWREVER